MRYKIGDTVKIRDDLEEDEYYYDEDENHSDSVNSQMIELGGRIAVITDYSGMSGYRLDIDNDRWNWMDDMFVGKVTGESHKYSPFQSWENSISQ